MKHWLKIDLDMMTFVMVVITVIGLGYTVYRAHINEQNQTRRQAGFALLMTANKLQTSIDKNFYNNNSEEIHYKGWSYVAFIDDMVSFMNPEVIQEAKGLHHLWQASTNELSDKHINKQLSKQIARLRAAVRSNIKTLM